MAGYLRLDQKEADVVRLLVEFGLRCAEENGGMFMVAGVLERGIAPKFSSETMRAIIPDFVRRAGPLDAPYPLPQEVAVPLVAEGPVVVLPSAPAKPVPVELTRPAGTPTPSQRPRRQARTS